MRRRREVPTRSYDIPDGAGGFMRIGLAAPPDERTIQALQELAGILRKRAPGVTPLFAGLLRSHKRPLFSHDRQYLFEATKGGTQ